MPQRLMSFPNQTHYAMPAKPAKKDKNKLKIALYNDDKYSIIKT
jgi:hypothetical protein